jgi:hypothetical protein
MSTAFILSSLCVTCLVGCEPPRPKLFDENAIRATKRVLVLPLADAPSKEASGSGAAFRGSVEQELLNDCGLDVINLSKTKLAEITKKTGLDIIDAYDPDVAAEIAREFKADTAVTGQLLHYTIQREMSSTTITFITGGGTNVTHWVSVSLRLVEASSGKIIYTGTGTAQDPEGFTNAASQAVKQALASLTHFLTTQK